MAASLSEAAMDCAMRRRERAECEERRGAPRLVVRLLLVMRLLVSVRSRLRVVIVVSVRSMIAVAVPRVLKHLHTHKATATSEARAVVRCAATRSSAEQSGERLLLCTYEERLVVILHSVDDPEPHQTAYSKHSHHTQ